MSVLNMLPVINELNAEKSIIEKTIAGAYINNDVENVRPYAFYKCSALTEVSFPTCTEIGQYAFRDCSALTEVSFPACSYIGSSAFISCSALAEVSFPACTEIGTSAFYWCTSLESLWLLGSELVTLASYTAFRQTPLYTSSYLGYYGSIYVLNSLADSFRTANNWSVYSERIVGV